MRQRPFRHVLRLSVMAQAGDAHARGEVGVADHGVDAGAQLLHQPQGGQASGEAGAQMGGGQRLDRVLGEIVLEGEDLVPGQQ